jgi:aspartyl-tRNA(Asn)/glutamyl-tRNA(Gln) amidotransferase subunit A
MSGRNAGAYETAAAVRAGRLTARKAVEDSLARIEALDSELGAFICVDREQALRRADEIDARLSRGEPVGALAGVPVAVKDNICTLNGATTCGSKSLAGYRSPYQACVVERINRADAVVVGKTNLDEFAMGSSTESSTFLVTRNPWSREFVPGGSSGGSAVAVAADMVPVALGSDTGGSVRQPAALCGATGLKPTYGRVSRYGLVAYGSSLDQIGPIARDVRDVGLVLGVIAGRDPRDSTSVDRDVPDYVAECVRPLGGVRLGVAPEYFGEGLDPEVRSCVEEAIEVYKGLGAEVVEVHLPHLEYCIACYYLIATAEASSNLARYDGVHYGHRAADFEDLIDLYASSRAEGLGAEVQRRIMLGTYALSSGYYDAYYLKAQKVRTLIKRDVEEAFEQADVIVGPTSPVPGFKLGERLDDPLAMFLADVYTVSANLAGTPAISIPCGFSTSGLPIGLQLTAPHFAESRLLQVAHAYQERTDWHTARPPL